MPKSALTTIGLSPQQHLLPPSPQQTRPSTPISTYSSPHHHPQSTITTTVTSNAPSTGSIYTRSLRAFAKLIPTFHKNLLALPYHQHSAITMSSSTSKLSSASAAKSSTTATKPKPLTLLTLPVLETLSPLTEGTSLPHVELEPSPPPTPNNELSSSTAATASSSTPQPTEPLSPLSPTSPGSVRKFLSKVSLHSTYNSDAASLASPTSPKARTPSVSGASTMTANTTKKRSWWRRGKSQAMVQPVPLNLEERIERKRTPPPVVQLGSVETSFEEDMFKGFK